MSIVVANVFLVYSMNSNGSEVGKRVDISRVDRLVVAR